MVKGKQRVNLFIDPEIISRAKIHAAKNLLSLSRLTENALKNVIPTGKMSDEKVIEKMDKMFKEYQQWKKNRKG